MERSWKGKQLPLRSYSGDDVARYDWKDGTLTAQTPLVRTLAIFETGSVKRKGDTLLLDGHRFTLMRKDAKLVGSVEVPMKLEVELHGSDPAVVLPTLAEGLFFDSVGAAVAGVPVQYQSFVPWKMPQSPQAGLGPAPAPGPDQVWIERDGAWTGIASGDPKLQKPRVTFFPEPRFSEEARKNKISGTVGVCLVVDKAGGPTDLWIAAPAKAGLDESSIEAVRYYLFDPARFNGEPVSTSMAVEVNFQVF